ncbi:MAG: hypothetical protein GTO45_30570 [Candidatus Aminicenantes bacterium]|nr:hypothetical protein [Candidatus Aminicenantes bacterium]NIM83137.1 hypothetical protein [Candidatus Aminicenantes bacterium]NIN22517.1 hypothetical protein [Candidatus Aminicenantes bacterium]NIN46285.1 hypothetical protein [Candidatus Aminicenantes bacterium]NIN89123.1 hypothetical protein [Candidatus Aminicenantes bacterium]
MNTNTLNQETSKRYSRLRLWWNLFWFRFAAGRAKPVSAQKFLNRIPLPDSAADKGAFQAEEKKLWRKYVDQDGNLRLITWGNIFSSLLKTVIGIVVIAVLAWGAYHLIAALKEYNELKSKAKTVHKFQPDTDTGKEFKLLNGKSIVVDMKHSPIFLDKRVYLPVPVLKGEESHLFYFPGKKFSGELISLADGSLVRNFLLTDGNTFSYLYNPKKAKAEGTWLQEPQFAELKTAIKTGKVFFVKEGKAVELRSKPRESAKPILKIPNGQRVIFVRFAPISSIASKLVWVQVRYPAGPGKDHQGWMAAVSIMQPFVEAELGPNTLKIINPALSFRKTPSTHAAKIPGVNKLKKGTKVEFLKFAPLANILSSKYAMIQVRYTHKPGEDYTGWIAAGKISEKFIGKIDVPKKESLGSEDKSSVTK